MMLLEFVHQKLNELEQQYKSVSLDSAITVQLSKNSYIESYLLEETETDTNVKEIKLHDLPDNITANFQPNGTKVTFEVVPQRKRKSIRKEYYLLWV